MLLSLQAQAPPQGLSMAESVFAGSKNVPRTKASMQRAGNLATYDSANEAEQAGTAANKAKDSASLPGQLAFAVQPLHTDPAGEQRTTRRLIGR